MVHSEFNQQQWLESLLARHNLTATELARRADLNPSTLTRFLQPGGREGHELSARTIRKIKIALNITDKGAGADARGFAESDAQPLLSMEAVAPDLRAAVNVLKGGRNGVDIWEIKSAGLEAIRLGKGDLAVVDLNASPMPGDRVCAQIYDHHMGTATTIFRLWKPPYLLSGGVAAPEVADQRNVVIVGVVIATLSPRDLMHAA